MSHSQAPSIVCPRVDPVWWDAPADCAGWPSLQMKQAWREAPDAAFAPATVQVAWDGARLLVRAALVDRDIFNPEQRFNAPAFLVGDAFELFIRPADQDAYCEFHVTPHNQLFQLRIPSAEQLAACRGAGIQEAWKISAWRIESAAFIDASEARWTVAARLPLERICEQSRPRTGSEFLVSFSRYDYTRGQAQPVHSSTSAHAKLDFHRQQEWRRIVLG